MMKITKIELDNYRVYRYPTVIDIPKGENLLIYGENGSGKTSLAKSVINFFESSIDSAINFEHNFFCTEEEKEGRIKLTFSKISDPDSVPVQYVWSNNPTLCSNKEIFIKSAARIHGHINYSRLLKVYLHNGDNPNLFDLIVLELLGNYNPPSERSTIQYIYRQLENGLFNVYTRKNRNHKAALAMLTTFESILRTTLDKCFERINEWLKTYFSHLQLRVEYELKPMEFSYGNKKSQWTWIRDLRLKVYNYDRNISQYNSILNEARLSAISMLLLLCSIYENPALCNYKFLYLDDAFIGLDNANRRQILSLLVKEFGNWQIFISTYDLTWYNAACEMLLNNWIKLEIFEGMSIDGNHPMTIITKRNDSITNALRHIFDQHHPDYPAAANYLRKSVEEILITRFPSFALRDENYEIIPTYKLAGIISSLDEFLSQTDSYHPHQAVIKNCLSVIKSHLPTLLHPLSHYSTQTPIYKNELIEVINHVIQLDKIGRELDYCNIVVLKEKHMSFELKICGYSGWDFNYQLNLCQNLYLFKTGSDWSLSFCKVQTVRYFGNDAAGKKYDNPIGKTNRLYNKMCYSSLKEAYDQILNYIINEQQLKDVITANYIESISFINEDHSITCLSDILSNKQKEIVGRTAV